jgi:hypothetical protein
MGIRFFETIMGRRFFEGTIPFLVNEFVRLNDNLERLNNNLEKNSYEDSDDKLKTETKQE